MKTIIALLLTAVAASARAENVCPLGGFDNALAHESSLCSSLGVTVREALAAGQNARVQQVAYGAAAATTNLSGSFNLTSRVLRRDVPVRVDFTRTAAPLAGAYACGEREIGDPGDGYSERVPASTLTVAPGAMSLTVDGSRDEFPMTGTALLLQSCEHVAGATRFDLQTARGGNIMVEKPVAGTDMLLRVSVELVRLTGDVRADVVTGYGETTLRVNASLVRRIDRGYSFLENFPTQVLTLR